MQQVHLQDLEENRYVLHPPSCMRDEDFEEIEAYVDHLKTAVEEFRDSSWTAWSGVGSQISETTDALCLKADVILWRLRVAKRLAYPARQVLWEDIQPSIANLEEGAESMVNNSPTRARAGKRRIGIEIGPNLRRQYASAKFARGQRSPRAPRQRP